MKVGKRHKFILPLFTIAVLHSCQQEYTAVEYKQWIESEGSGLHKQKEVGGMLFDVQYQTPEYMVILNKGPLEFESCDLETELDNYGDESHRLIFTIDNSEAGIAPLEYGIVSENEYYGRIQYLNSEVSKDFFMLAGTDTLPCRFAHFERDFGISPTMRLNLAFDKNPTPMEEDMQLCFEDRLFNNGLIKFTFDQDDLNDLPELIQQ